MIETGTKGVATSVAVKFEFPFTSCKNFPRFFFVGGAPTTQLFGSGLAGKSFLETVAAPTPGTRTQRTPGTVRAPPTVARDVTEI